MDHGHHHHHNLYHLYSAAALNIDADSGSDNRFPQWSLQETQDFLVIRAELDPTFMETKRNKLLWEVVSCRMKEKGYNRSGEQCKCKWKNLVTRYKGCEAMTDKGMRQQFPFYNELQIIFAARLQRMRWQESAGRGGGSSRQKLAAAATHFSSDEEEVDHAMSEGRKKRKTKAAEENYTNAPPMDKSDVVVSGICEVMDDYMRQQLQMEVWWLEAYERREEERRAKEVEWRQTMEALENERLIMERRWGEWEEQRRAREEQKAEERDALITTLLNKLIFEDSNT